MGPPPAGVIVADSGPVYQRNIRIGSALHRGRLIIVDVLDVSIPGHATRASEEIAHFDDSHDSAGANWTTACRRSLARSS